MACLDFERGHFDSDATSGKLSEMHFQRFLGTQVLDDDERMPGLMPSPNRVMSRCYMSRRCASFNQGQISKAV